ncbi:MAG: ferrochelatase [Burkholderiaceae bacterium]|jgi:ferrochelatase|nr:ferrochelatase [Burkholderiaceae bacterium]
MSYQAEAPFKHGSAERVGVLLVNLGTPDAPTPAALRRYLAEFLSDPRVVEIPKLLWWMILHGVILRVRPAKSALKYAAIWTPEGSPLAVWTAKQANLLLGYLGQAGHPVLVRHAMRYGQPGIAAEMDALRAAGATRVLVLPLYPQYSAATSASVFDAVAAWGQRSRWVPELRFVQQYHDDPGYIAALAEQVRMHWQREGRGSMLVMSFHGVPERTLHLGDPYHCSCHKTARLLAAQLGLPQEQYRVTFQSRFGKAQWLQPYTEPTLQQLAREGIERVDILCPGFVADCLETLEEIDQEAREAFIAAGGKTLHYIPCLNDRHEWILALRDIALRHLQGWNTQPPSGAELQAQRELALRLGAAD